MNVCLALLLGVWVTCRVSRLVLTHTTTMHREVAPLTITDTALRATSPSARAQTTVLRYLGAFRFSFAQFLTSAGVSIMLSAPIESSSMVRTMHVAR